MVFLAEHKESIPEKDLLSWTFDDLPYDADKPVSEIPRIRPRAERFLGIH